MKLLASKPVNRPGAAENPILAILREAVVLDAQEQPPIEDIRSTAQFILNGLHNGELHEAHSADELEHAERVLTRLADFDKLGSRTRMLEQFHMELLEKQRAVTSIKQQKRHLRELLEAGVSRLYLETDALPDWLFDSRYSAVAELDHLASGESWELIALEDGNFRLSVISPNGKNYFDFSSEEALRFGEILIREYKATS